MWYHRFNTSSSTLSSIQTRIVQIMCTSLMCILHHCEYRRRIITSQTTSVCYMCYGKPRSYTCAFTVLSYPDLCIRLPAFTYLPEVFSYQHAQWVVLYRYFKHMLSILQTHAYTCAFTVLCNPDLYNRLPAWTYVPEVFSYRMRNGLCCIGISNTYVRSYRPVHKQNWLNTFTIQCLTRYMYWEVKQVISVMKYTITINDK